METNRSRIEFYQENQYYPQERTTQEIEEIIKNIRLELYNRGLFCGAEVIYSELKALKIRPLPSVRTIGRILARHGLTHGRTGYY